LASPQDDGAFGCKQGNEAVRFEVKFSLIESMQQNAPLHSQTSPTIPRHPERSPVLAGRSEGSHARMQKFIFPKLELDEKGIFLVAAINDNITYFSPFEPLYFKLSCGVVIPSEVQKI
jgi:hypothetical protein